MVNPGNEGSESLLKTGIISNFTPNTLKVILIKFNFFFLFILYWLNWELKSISILDLSLLALRNIK